MFYFFCSWVVLLFPHHLYVIRIIIRHELMMLNANLKSTAVILNTKKYYFSLILR